MDFNPSGGFSAVTYSFFKNKYPYYSTKNYPYKTDSKKIDKYSTLSTVSIIIAIVYLFVWPVFYAAILSKIVPTFYHVITPNSAQYYPPEWLMYLVTAIPLTIGTLVWLHEWTFKLFLQNDYEEFEDFYNSKQGYDNKKAGVLMAKIGLVCTLITVPFIFGSRVILYEDSITVKIFYDVTASTYKYEEIDRVVLYEHYQNKKGSINESNHYVVHFTDGTDFYLGYYINDSLQIQALAVDIETRSGKPITNLDIDYYEQ